MTTPEENVTIPNPTKEKSNAFQKVLAFFAVIGVIGLGTCGYTLAGRSGGAADVIGAALIFASLVGLVITAVCMAISSILKATKK